MYLRTEKRCQYFEEVIRLHHEKGYGGWRISKILPIDHSTASRWIAFFAAENVEKHAQMPKSKPKSWTRPEPAVSRDSEVKALQEELARLQAHLKHEKLRADAYDELINVAEAKFKITIRKKLATNGSAPACKECEGIPGKRSLQAVWRDKTGVLQA
jgi:hypothetical protein